MIRVWHPLIFTRPTGVVNNALLLRIENNFCWALTISIYDDFHINSITGAEFHKFSRVLTFPVNNNSDRQISFVIRDL